LKKGCLPGSFPSLRFSRYHPFDFFLAMYFLIARRLFCLLRRCQFFRASCFMLILLVRRDKPGGLFADGSSARLRVSHPPDLSHAWFSFNQTLQRLRSSKGRHFHCAQNLAVRRTRNSTPLCARETSPGLGIVSPPTRPASERV